VSRQFNVDELFAAQVAARWEPNPNNRFPILEAGNGATRRSSTSVSCGHWPGVGSRNCSARSLRLRAGAAARVTVPRTLPVPARAGYRPPARRGRDQTLPSSPGAGRP